MLGVGFLLKPYRCKAERYFFIQTLRCTCIFAYGGMYVCIHTIIEKGAFWDKCIKYVRSAVFVFAEDMDVYDVEWEMFVRPDGRLLVVKRWVLFPFSWRQWWWCYGKLNFLKERTIKKYTHKYWKFAVRIYQIKFDWLPVEANDWL